MLLRQSQLLRSIDARRRPGAARLELRSAWACTRLRSARLDRRSSAGSGLAV